jgi:gluconate 2-dehydrogenase gamma chain
LYLTQPEVRFIEAAVSRLIPSDELGPGAKEAGVANFIDRQLASAWGTHSRNSRMGPWRQGTPQQGSQSPLTPQEFYRAAIRETDIHCSDKYGRTFHALKPEQQDEVLRALEEGQIELATAPAKFFFGMLWTNTEEGFFSDPIHGGNRDKIGWKLVGFPGVASVSYVDQLQKHNQPYRPEPISILDIVENRAAVDAQGYPKRGKK